MRVPDRVYAVTDKPMTWTRAIILGTLIIAVSIALLAQLPSLIIYWADQEVARIIEWSTKIPGVNDNGLNTIQIRMIRDIVANAVQMGLLTGMLIAAYIWLERKRKRTGGKGQQDVVKGYLSGK